MMLALGAQIHQTVALRPEFARVLQALEQQPLFSFRPGVTYIEPNTSWPNTYFCMTNEGEMQITDTKVQVYTAEQSPICGMDIHFKEWYFSHSSPVNVCSSRLSGDCDLVKASREEDHLEWTGRSEVVRCTGISRKTVWCQLFRYEGMTSYEGAVFVLRCENRYIRISNAVLKDLLWKVGSSYYYPGKSISEHYYIQPSVYTIEQGDDFKSATTNLLTYQQSTPPRILKFLSTLQIHNWPRESTASIMVTKYCQPITKPVEKFYVHVKEPFWYPEGKSFYAKCPLPPKAKSPCGVPEVYIGNLPFRPGMYFCAPGTGCISFNETSVSRIIPSDYSHITEDSWITAAVKQVVRWIIDLFFSGMSGLFGDNWEQKMILAFAVHLVIMRVFGDVIVATGLSIIIYLTR